MPRRIRLPLIKDDKCLLKLSGPHKLSLLRFYLGYMPVCYNRLTAFGIWAEVPAELGLEAIDQVGGLETSFWHRDLRVIDLWNDDPEHIERWNHASDNSPT